MQIIAELEQEARGLYTGAIGYLEPGGDFCFSVPIRTVVSSAPGKALMGVGSGIVYDSDADAEYAEVQLKTRFLQEVNRELGLIESMRLNPDGSISHRQLHMARLATGRADLRLLCTGTRHSGKSWMPMCKHHPQTRGPPPAPAVESATALSAWPTSPFHRCRRGPCSYSASSA